MGKQTGIPISGHWVEKRTMKACVLQRPAPIEAVPLTLEEVRRRPKPSGDQVLVRVNACGVCRTDLHVHEGELCRSATTRDSRPSGSRYAGPFRRLTTDCFTASGSSTL